MSTALQKRYGHAGGGDLSAQGFIDMVRSQLQVGDRQVSIRITPSWGPVKNEDVLIDFINLPAGVGSAGGGAEGENNRAMFMVRGFGPAGAAPATGKVKVEQLKSNLYSGSGAPSRETRVTMRAKTAAPPAMAKYIADFLNKVVREVAPNFTHTKV